MESNSQMTQRINPQNLSQLILKLFTDGANRVIEALQQNDSLSLLDLESLSVQDLTRIGISEGSAGFLRESL